MTISSAEIAFQSPPIYFEQSLHASPRKAGSSMFFANISFNCKFETFYKKVGKVERKCDELD